MLSLLVTVLTYSCHNVNSEDICQVCSFASNLLFEGKKNSNFFVVALLKFQVLIYAIEEIISKMPK